MTRQHRGGRAVASTRLRLWQRDAGRCGRCGKVIDLDASPMGPFGLTIGHVIPLSHGGSDDDANLRPEHRRCNLAAGNRPTMPRATLATPPGF